MKKIIALILFAIIIIIGCDQTDEKVIDPVIVDPVDPANVSYQYIYFEDLKPEGFSLNESWDAMGIDGKERVYLGITSSRDDGREDFLVFRYDPVSGEREYLGSLIDVTTESGNYQEGEEIPKGHTKMIFIDGKMYLASQGFHDFKGGISTLYKYRGSHLYTIDTDTGDFTDISADLPFGVVTKNQGIIALSYMPSKNLLVGLTHPHSDIVLYDLATKKVRKVVSGIPWELNNPLSREIVTTKDGKIYTYRGTEEPSMRDQEFNMYVYDVNSDNMSMTEYKCKGGFWNGKVETKNGDNVYISTCNGELYNLDVASGELAYLRTFLPDSEIEDGEKIDYFWSITLSNDETKIYAIPTLIGNLYEYDILTNNVRKLKYIDGGAITGSNIIDSSDNLYFCSFDWHTNVKLLMISLR